MAQEQQACTWLARKYLVYSIGIYTTILGIMVADWFGVKLGLPLGLSTFLSSFFIVFARTFYEQMVVHEVPLKSVTLKKNIEFALLYACSMSFCYHFIKAPLGYWGLPIVFVITQKIIKPIVSYLWPIEPRNNLYALYSQKKDQYMASLYGFFGILAFIAVSGYTFMGVSFIYSFGIAVLVALVASILFEVHYLYEQHFKPKNTALLLFFGLMLAITSTTIVVILIKFAGFQGKPVTIAVSVAVKIVEQYLLSKWMCSQKTCILCQKL